MQKNIITYIVAVFITFAVSATAWAQSSYSNAVMALNPAGYWPLNETSAPPQVLDLTATNNGTLGAAGNGSYGAWYQSSGNQWYLTNDIVTEASPLANGDPALDCQFHAGQYIILPRNTNGVANSALTIKPPFSLEAWVQVGTVSGQLGGIISEGEVQDLAGGPNPTNPFYGGSETGVSWAGFSFGQFSDFFFFDCYETNAYNTKANEIDSCKTSGTPPGALTVGQWVYVVCTYDGTTEFMYTNNVLAASKKVAANLAGLTYVPDPTAPLMIGSGSDVPFDYGVSFEGGLADVAIYNEILPQASMTTHYQTAGGTNATFGANYAAAVAADSPTLYFRMKDNQSTVNAGYPSSSFPVANNYGSLGTAANGVYQQGTTPGVVGPSFAGFGANSKSVAINGWLGAVDVGNSNIPAALNPTGPSPLTVVSWFQTGPADAPGRFQEILGHSDNSYRLSLGQFPNVDAHFNPGPGPELQFSSPAQSATNGFAFNDGQWHMVAGVSDGTNEYLYLDGSLALSNNNPAGIKITGTNDDLLLGGDPEYTYANVNTTVSSIRDFDGQIAQVSFFTNALTVTQVQSLFNAAEVPPYIWQEPSPVSTSINAGQSVTISTGIRGSALTYQWYTTNGVAVTGQTGASLVFSPVTTTNAGSYYLVASSSFGAVTSSVVSITVFGPPSVTQQTPTQLQIFSGSSPTLHVTASGASPLVYQWNLNGTAITGATNSAYTLTNLQANGSYGCSVTNVLGSNAIAAITVTVLTEPTAPYPVHVLADGPMAYYRLDEASGATTAFDYVGGLNGSYSNVVTGLSGYTSQNPSQTDTDPNETAAGFGFIPSENPNNDYAGNVPSYLNFGTPSGSNAEFTVEAWVQEALYNGVGDCIVGLGSGGSEQFVLDTGATASGFLRFFVRNAGGFTSSASSTSQLANDGLWHHVVGVCDEAGGNIYLYLDGKQVATGTITNRSGLLSSSVPLSIGARQSGNSTPPTYDDQFLGFIDDVSIYNKALTASQVQGDYYASGIIPLNIQVQPSNLVTNQGSIVTFTSSTQGGTPPLSYQWFDNNNNMISGATNTSLSLTNVQPSQSGNYSLTVMNAYGSTNVQASLTVNQGPATISVDIQPTSVTAFAGDAVTLSIIAGGSAPLYYQWFQDGIGVSGATNSTYSFAALAGTNTYFCSVTNAFSFSEGHGPAVSSTATVAGQAVSTVTPANYNSKLKITFAGYNRSETLSYFPVLVRLSTNLVGFSYAGFASATGSDLRFADSSGTRELPYEIETWDDSNGVSSVWVQMPQLSSTNSFIWAYWGNPSDTTQPTYTTNGAVWEPASFLGLPGYDVVYHLQQAGFPYLDSTLNYPALNGVAPTLVGGIVGYGQSFNGSGDYLDAGDVNLGTNFTESAWVNLSASESSIQGVWANGPGGFSTSEAALFINDYQTTDGALLFGTDNEQPETVTGLVTPSQWHLVTAAVNRPAGTIQFYVDGNPQPLSGSGSAGVSTDFLTNSDMNLGRFNAGSFPFKGTMDEARIHGGIDDSNWVWADYMTVASNSVFSAYSTVSNTFTLPSGLTIQYIGGGKVVVSWTGGTLQSATQVTGPYVNVPDVTSPYTNTPSGQTQFYRLQGQF